MSRFLYSRKVQVEEPKQAPKDEPKQAPKNDDKVSETLDENPKDEDLEREESGKLTPSDSNLIEDPEPFLGVKVRRKASIRRDYRGDYLDVPSRAYLLKILEKQGDMNVLFADKVLKFTASGKMKRRTLIITDFAIYLVDPDTDALKRRVALAAVEKLALSELSDNFFAIIVPTEYDLLMASTRKTEIVTVLVDSMKNTSNFDLEVLLSNSFEYHAAAELVKEVQFEEVEGGIKTRIVKK